MLPNKVYLTLTNVHLTICFVKKIVFNNRHRYECPDLTTLDANFCHVNGKTYQKGETVSKDDSTPCSEDCICADR